MAIPANEMKYSGIGSRETPEHVCRYMTDLAAWLASHGLLLRSGGAAGADEAFERGSDYRAGKKEIYRATTTIEAMEMAARFHPAWDKCSTYARMLHARNSHIIMGAGLDDPVDFIVCWTVNAAVKGGTGQALRIAAHYGILVFNLAKPGEDNQLKYWLQRYGIT